MRFIDGLTQKEVARKLGKKHQSIIGVKSQFYQLIKISSKDSGSRYIMNMEYKENDKLTLLGMLVIMSLMIIEYLMKKSIL